MYCSFYANLQVSWNQYWYRHVLEMLQMKIRMKHMEHKFKIGLEQGPTVKHETLNTGTWFPFLHINKILFSLQWSIGRQYRRKQFLVLIIFSLFSTIFYFSVAVGLYATFLLAQILIDNKSYISPSTIWYKNLFATKTKKKSSKMVSIFHKYNFIK